MPVLGEEATIPFTIGAGTVSPAPAGGPEPEVPQLAVPFAFTSTGVATVEQGSPADIEGCIQNVLACPIGVSLERPGFGITRPQFQNAPLNLRRLLEQVVRGEPRATLEALENVLGEQERGIVLEVSP